MRASGRCRSLAGSLCECAAGGRRAFRVWWAWSYWWRGPTTSAFVAVVFGAASVAGVGAALLHWPLPTGVVLAVIALVLFVLGRTWAYDPDPADDPKVRLAVA